MRCADAAVALEDLLARGQPEARLGAQPLEERAQVAGVPLGARDLQDLAAVRLQLLQPDGVDALRREVGGGHGAHAPGVGLPAAGDRAQARGPPHARAHLVRQEGQEARQRRSHVLAHGAADAPGGRLPVRGAPGARQPAGSGAVGRGLHGGRGQRGELLEHALHGHARRRAAGGQPVAQVLLPVQERPRHLAEPAQHVAHVRRGVHGLERHQVGQRQVQAELLVHVLLPQAVDLLRAVVVEVDLQHALREPGRERRPAAGAGPRAA